MLTRVTSGYVPLRALFFGFVLFTNAGLKDKAVYGAERLM